MACCVRNSMRHWRQCCLHICQRCGNSAVFVQKINLFFFKKWLILARFISGAGFSLDGSFMGSLSRLYPPSKKAKIFAMCLLIRQTGVTFAPGLIVFLQKISFRFIWTDVNRYSASGFIMACSWTLFFVLFLIFFKEPKEDENKEEIQFENTGSSFYQNN